MRRLRKCALLLERVPEGGLEEAQALLQTRRSVSNDIAQMGPDYIDRRKAMDKWSNLFSIFISMAALSALDIMHRPERIETFLFHIDISFLGPTAKPPYTYSIVSAKCIPLHEARALAAKISPEEFAALALLPGMVRVQMWDKDFPWLHLTPFVVPKGIVKWERDLDWFANLQKSVTPRE
ncbi:hypothetical protein B0H10DRAFT_2197832 [Mycena sp. CBHHK59/15]|nr:hypothetical protein B0H10DRAFT_2197832 [Mycena sp. CBHHK59/15]